VDYAKEIRDPENKKVRLKMQLAIYSFTRNMKRR